MARRSSLTRRRRPSGANHSRPGGAWSRGGIFLLVLGAVGAAAWFFRAELGFKNFPATAGKPPLASNEQATPVELLPAKELPVLEPRGLAEQVQPPLEALLAPVVIVTPPRLPVADATGYPRVVSTLLEAQIALARRWISSGSIDGVAGAQTAAALAVFQELAGLPRTGRLDEATRARLVLTSAAFKTYLVTSADFVGLQPLAPTWVGKAEQRALEHETLLERLAERCQAHPNLLRQLNPSVKWDSAAPGLALNLPAIERNAPPAPVALLHVRLAQRVLQVRDAEGGLIAHFPVSIAKRVEKRPVGALRVTSVVPNPNYTFNPEVFSESAEARELDSKLILAPGPNNPVGVVWIGLDLAGYGIHGTPSPEQVGRTESRGCFRLANWDARALLDLVRVGLPVRVEL
ncbi:MAG: murein L,D-transpeptidase [Verrucomicrobia bacterium]|nr:MAG: murein L,D-transpeptidase [Verrucomicrobiota bacterium]